MPKVFLNHAATDKPLVDDVKVMIQSAVGIAPGEFFYSSGSGTGVPAGQNFVEYIRTEMADSTFVVSIITPAFRESEFCLAELGAVWLAAEKDFFPLCVPSVDRGSLQATLTGIQVERIDEQAALMAMLQRVAVHFEREFEAAAATDAVSVFQATLGTRLDDLAEPSTVPMAEFKQSAETVTALGAELADARKGLAEAEAQFDELKEAKTAEEIEAITRPADFAEEVAALIKDARSAVGKLDRDVQQTIPFALRETGMPKPSSGSWESADVEKQVDEGYLKDMGDGKVYLNREWPEIDHALNAVLALQWKLERSTPDESDWFRQEFGVPADMSAAAAFREVVTRSRSPF